MSEVRSRFRQVLLTPAPAVQEPAKLPAVIEPSRLDVLAPQIRSANAKAIVGFAEGTEAAILAGKLLIEAKAACPHGLWQDYVAVECRLGLRTAQLYMKLAKQEPQLRQLLAAKTKGASFLSQAEALRLLSVAQQKRRKSKPTPEA
jgi:hypothetical protein